MAPTAFPTLVQQQYDALSAEERADLVGVRVEDDEVPHPFLEDHWMLVDLAHGPDGPVVVVHRASFQRLANREPGFDADRELDDAFVYAVNRHHEDRHAAQEIPDEDALYVAHAAFRRGEPLAQGWYRRAERLAPYLYALDLDVFLELPLRAAEWARLQGQALALRLGTEGDGVAFDVPSDADPGEVWTLTGAGFGEDDDDPEDGEDPEDDEPTARGPRGDLHVVPLVYG